MCGILGFTSQQYLEKEVFEEALNALAARGPDDEGVYKDTVGDSQIFFGNRRLAILDLTEAGHQPMVAEDGAVAITLNGEIYNYRKLRGELRRRGHHFNSDSDTEVLLKGYLEHGTDVVKKLDGMSAFAIYDRHKQKIFCARDHFGKKPFYYFHDHTTKTFAFASELKAFNLFRNGLNINNLAVRQFLVFGYIPSPNSVYQEIKKLPPATALVYDLETGRITQQWCYWRLEKVRIDKKISLDDAVERLEDLLHASIESRLITDVPLGSFLSGGIDSSLITAIASEHSSRLDTFTVTYEDERIDEEALAKLTSRHLKITPHFFRFRDEDVRPTVNKVLDYMDEPFADAALIPTAFLSEQTRKNVTVALSGDGGDELFGGYPKHRAQLLAERIPSSLFLSRRLTNLLRDRGSNLSKFLQGLRYDLPARQFYWGLGGFLPENERVFAQSYHLADLFQQDDLGNKSLFLDLSLLLPDGYLAKIDRASMMHSLEVRTPFLQKELVELAFSLPSNYKFGLLHSKKILKKVAQRYLPEEIVQRSKKGFAVPLNLWLRTVLRERVTESLQKAQEHPTLLRRGYGGQAGVLSGQSTQKLWQEFLAGRDDHGTKIWRSFVLSEFLARTHSN